MKEVKGFLKKRFLIVGMVILLVGAGGVSFYFYNKYKAAEKLLSKKAEMVAENELEKVLKQVGKHIKLPTGETPTLATVSDKKKLGEEDFFKEAENGDKVLVYLEARKAILYRPSVDKIIEVSTVSKIEPSPTAAASPEPTKNPIPTLAVSLEEYKIAIYNGTMVVGLTKKYSAELLEVLPNADIVLKTDAKGNYKKSVVINTGNLDKEELEKIGQLLKLEAGVLPENESKPKEADFLIILGEDKKDL